MRCGAVGNLIVEHIPVDDLVGIIINYAKPQLSANNVEYARQWYHPKDAERLSTKDCRDAGALGRASEDGDVALVRWLIEDMGLGVFDVAPEGAFFGALYSESYDVIDYFMDRYNIPAALVKGDLEEFFIDCVDPGEYRGRLEDLMGVFGGKIPDEVIEAGFEYSLQNVDESDIRWYMSTFRITDTDRAKMERKSFKKACVGGNLSTAKHYATVCGITADDVRAYHNCLLHCVCAGGDYPDTVKWLVETFGLTADDFRDTFRSRDQVDGEAIACAWENVGKCSLKEFRRVLGSRCSLQIAGYYGNDQTVDWLVERFTFYSEEREECGYWHRHQYMGE